MRQRVQSSGAHPSVNTVEWSWTQTGQPYKRDKLVRGYYDNLDTVYWNWTPPTQNSLNLRREELIEDDEGIDGKFRGCYHHVRSNEYYLQEKAERYAGHHCSNAHARCLFASDWNFVNSRKIAPEIDWDEMANEACSFMVPRLNEGTSLVNSILELRDLKRMNPIPSLRRLQGRHLTLKKLSGSASERKKFMSEIATRMNNAHLNAAFGIVPFLTDIISIHDELVGLAEKLARLKRSMGKRLQRHYKRVLPVSQGVLADTQWETTQIERSWVGQCQYDRAGLSTRPKPRFYQRSRWVKRPVYHATMRYSYTLPEADSKHEEVLAKLDTLGVRLDPSIVWNAIPFSFTVDWVVDVSGFLQKMARDNYPINTTIHEFCHSYKWHKFSEVTVQVEDNDSAIMMTPTELLNRPLDSKGSEREAIISQHQERVYDRRLASPNYSAIAYRALKLRQGALAGSLLLARKRWFKSTRYQKDMSFHSR